MNGVQINLKCSSFLTHIISSFNTHQDSDLFTDVTLVSDDNKKIQAHKLILSAGSEFFRDILSDKAHPYPMLCLDGVSSDDLEWIIKYLYVGEVSVPQSGLQKFLKIANKFKCFGLNQEEQHGIGEEETEGKCTDNEIEPVNTEKGALFIENEEVTVFDERDHYQVQLKPELNIPTTNLNECRGMSDEEEEHQGLKTEPSVGKCADNETDVLNEGNNAEEDSEPVLEDDESLFTENFIVDNVNMGALLNEYEVVKVLDDSDNKQAEPKKLCDLKEGKPIIDRKKGKPLFEFCRISGKTVSKQHLYEYLKEHYERKKDKTYKCNYCENSSRLKERMMEHVQRHLTHLEFDCGICGRTLKRTKALRNHKVTHVPNAARRTKALKNPKVKHVLNSAPKFDDRIFMNNLVLEEKKAEDEEQQNRKLRKDEEQTNMKVSLSQIVKLQTPVIPETPPTQAERLREHWTDFFTFSEIQGHLVCDICNTQFKSKVSAYTHHQTTHLGMRFPCHYCNYLATTRYRRRYHIKTLHPNENEVTGCKK